MPGANILLINLFYHPDSSLGNEIFKGLTERLYNVEQVNLEMDFKILVLSIPYEIEKRQLPHFNTNLWGKYDQNIVLVILDNALVTDVKSIEFINFLIEFESKNNNTCIIPLTDSINVGSSDQVKLFKNKNILRPLALIKDNVLGIVENTNSFLSIFYIEFYHFLIKKFINNTSSLNINKVIFFLSHTKDGGVEITLKIKKFIEGVTQLNRFFDVQDIQIDEDFEKEIKEWIAKPETVFLTVLTDNYTTRQICKMEVLFAKKAQKPILTIGAIKSFERRSFPYLNNTPVIIWEDTPQKILLIIEVALREFLRSVVVKKEMLNFVNEKGINALCITFPPELLTLSYFYKMIQSGNEHLIVYPSPIMDESEKKLLNNIAPNIKFLTPWQIP